MTTASKPSLNRRQFVLAGVCVVGAAAIGAGGLGLWRRGTRNSTVVFRNPAYNLRRDSGDVVLACQTRQGQAIAFRVDEPAALFWERVPTAEDFAVRGERVTIAAVLDSIAPRFRNQKDSEWRRDAGRFAQEALRQGVLLADGAKLYVAPIAPRQKA